MINNLPSISIIIPCRNEEKFISKCLDSIIAQDYPKDKAEVLVVDGMSEDRTREIIKEYSKQHQHVILFDNPKKIVPTAMNKGIQNAHGAIIIRMDAHNIYEKDYVSKCVKYLQEYDVDNVGGIWVTLPGSNTLIAQSIAFALSHPFGVGNAYFRIGSKEPRYVDTVPFGCYKREVFQRIGLFDEDLVRNQDDEFNLRLTKNGGKLLLVPDIVSYYYARDSLKKLWKMYFQYGYYKPLVVKKIGAILTGRQLMPAIFVVGLIASGIFSFVLKPFLLLFVSWLFLYLSANIVASGSIAFKKGLKYIFVLPIVFATLHFSYGIGYLKGILDFIVFKKHRRNKIVDVPLTR
ncbi:MAG: glycosyltransferase family 2 protein [Planctomycetia bacterium]|nr:glycosyltransferase family 2 protein [Candidatus Brocadia sp.]QOJ06249.1 MAG: glycosyltransferase family 2 protein [Planctomycetia bacterium]TVL94795.1 MAG: glycosyltransferase family 2 protein [Candidatus Brocadia sp. BL1]HQU32177.1 glycosyltransferase family 2 protein [Candidatus Brocadia sapporoensis]